MMNINGKNKVRLFVSVFPSQHHDWENIKCDIDRKIIYVRHLFDFHSSVNITPTPKYWCFKTDKIFLNCCQSEIYTAVTDQILEKTYFGVDSVVLGYGQNHSGKTYTITGLQNLYDLRGIVPRFVVDLMNSKKDREEDFSTVVWISVVDIFGNSLYDLLGKSRPKCKDEKEVKRVRIKSAIHCLELFFKAEAARMTVEEKTYNAHSATNIVTFFVKTVSLNSQDTFNKLSKVHFVDLAGVETIERSPATSIKDKLTQSDANVTKSMLEIFALQNNSKMNVITTDKSRTHIVTKYLGNSLSIASNLKLICHIRPNREDLGITLSLLRFGMTFLNIKMVELQHNIEVNEDLVMKNLKEEVLELKDDILIKQMCENVGNIDISQGRIEFVKRSVMSYLKNDISEQELLSLVNDCSLVLNIIKSINKENLPPKYDKLSIGMQTDNLDQLKTSRTEERDDISYDVKDKISLKSENKRVSVPAPEGKKDSGTKNKSSKKKKPDKSETISKKSAKTMSGKKGEKASKALEKPELKEAEVQVNLIEPKSKLPNIDSREGLWALFLIKNSEVQALMEKNDVLINRRKKSYDKEQIKYETIIKSLSKVQLELTKLASFRHTESIEMYDQAGQMVISEEESKLAKQLTDLKEKSLIIKQKLIDAQTDWLDSLERMNCQKQLIDTKFKEFCVGNNLLPITRESVAQDISEKSTLFPQTAQTELLEDSNPDKSEILDFGPMATSIDNFQERYITLQSKYLKI